MSGRVKRREALRQQEIQKNRTHATRRRGWIAISVFLGLSISIVLAIVLSPGSTSRPAEQNPVALRLKGEIIRDQFAAAAIPAPTPLTNPDYPTLAQIIAMTPEELERVDIAVVNLRCAEGLPGAETINIAAELKTIDGWARRIESDTAYYYHLLREQPERYHGIVGKYCMDTLTTVLQRDLGIHYDPEQKAIIDEGRVNTPSDTFYDDARNSFILGLTQRLTGTCSSMPVLYVAIGRRLGYPLHLVSAPGHLYLRWKDSRSRFNIESTSHGGLMSHSDEEYWHWPKPVDWATAEKNYYFKPLSRRDELAEFLSARALFLSQTGKPLPAAQCQQQALEVAENLKAPMKCLFDELVLEMRERQLEQVRAIFDMRDRLENAQTVFNLKDSP